MLPHTPTCFAHTSPHRTFKSFIEPEVILLEERMNNRKRKEKSHFFIAFEFQKSRLSGEGEGLSYEQNIWENGS